MVPDAGRSSVASQPGSPRANDDRDRSSPAPASDAEPGGSEAATTPVASAPVIEELPRPSRVRSPSDVVRVVVSLVLVSVGYALAVGVRTGVADFQSGILESVAAWPRAVRDTVVGVTQLVAVVAPAALVVVLLLRRRFRQLVTILVAAVLAVGVVWIARSQALEGGHPTTWDITASAKSWLARTSFPPAEYLAAVAALTTVAGAWTSRRWRRAAAALLLALAVARAGTSATLALDLLFALTAGVAAGAAVLLLLGGPDRAPRGTDVAAAMAVSGWPLARLHQLPNGRSPTLAYRAEMVDGRTVHISVRDDEDRRRDLLYRAYLMVRLRTVGERHVFTSLRQDAEHEAFVTLWAARAGAPVAEPVVVTAVGAGGILIADEWIDGSLLSALAPDAITDDMLRDLWAAIGVLQDHHIAHRALRADVVVVEPTGSVTLLGFETAELDGPRPHLSADIAEALASTALLVGAERAVATATDVLGDGRVSGALPYLQPLALSRPSQRQLHHHKSVLKDLSERVAESTGTSAIELARLERVSPRALGAVLGAFVAMWVLLPKLADAGDAVEAVRQANPGFLVAMLPLTLLLYVGSTFELLGACSVPLQFGATYRCQMAAAFMNRITPSNVGGMAVNARYLQKCGVDAAAATATVGLTSAADMIVNVLLVIVFFTWAGRGTSDVSLSLPSSTALRVVIALVVIAGVIVVLTPRGRKLMREKVLPFLRGVRHSLVEVAHSPLRMLSMFGGGLGRAIVDFAALVIALAAFGSTPSIAGLGAAYVGASVLASASPTPGGVGAVEATLIAALTSIGVGISQATPAVLVYRLITYWLVMLPGWISLKVMEKRSEI
jgi:uncharacterized protein (TIRG00374 family)